jgi:hypothetical protein
LYYEILEKLKAQGFNESNLKEIIIYLYQQRTSAVKQLNEVMFYMKQMQINCENPLNGMKVCSMKLSLDKIKTCVAKQKKRLLN